MDNNKTAKYNDCGFLGILFFIFLILKLTGNIDWSWWWVCLPLYGPILLLLLLGAIFLIGYSLYYLIDQYRQ